MTCNQDIRQAFDTPGYCPKSTWHSKPTLEQETAFCDPFSWQPWTINGPVYPSDRGDFEFVWHSGNLEYGPALEMTIDNLLSKSRVCIYGTPNYVPPKKETGYPLLLSVTTIKTDPRRLIRIMKNATKYLRRK